MTSRILVLVLATATWIGCGGQAPPDPEDPPAVVCPEFVPAFSGLPEKGEWRTHPAIADVNGDGLADIAGMARKGKGPRVFLSDGLGGWIDASEGLEYPDGISCGIGVRLLDLNSDDQLDLLVADHCKGVRVFLGDGGTSWTRVTRGIPTNLQGFNDADAADLDGDGYMDIVAVSAYTNGFLVLRGMPGPSWEILWESGLPAVGSGWRLRLIDINHDDRIDILSTFNSTTSDRRDDPPPPAKVWLQQNALQFVPTDGFHEEGRFFGVDTMQREGRELPDVVFALIGAEASLQRWESDNGTDWRFVERMDTELFEHKRLAFGSVEIADIDGDGCEDLLTNESGSRVVWLALGDCRGGLELCPRDTLPTEVRMPFGWGVNAGDLNGDGRQDVVASYGGKTRGGILAWLQAGPSTAGRPRQGQGPEVSKVSRGSGETPDAP